MVDRLIFYFVVATHWIFLVLCGVSVPLLLICEPFYISIPMSAWIMHLGWSRVLECPWTRVENYAGKIRGKAPCIIHFQP